MALIKCTYCGHMVSDKGTKCPKCGTPIIKMGTAHSKEKEDKKVAEAESPKISVSQEESTPVKTTISTENSKSLDTIICIFWAIAIVGAFYMWQSKENVSAKYENDNMSTYLEELVKHAKEGDAVAQYNLGRCYFYGYGVNQDKNEAIRWWRKAAEKGLAEAQHNLGVSYYNGYGVNQDKNEAIRWWRKAAGQGYEESIQALKDTENEY